MSREQRIQHQRRLHNSHIKAHLNPAEVRTLLLDLCEKLGFCLPPLETERSTASPPEDSDEFTGAVLVAEGYGVPSQDPIVDQARELVAQAFRRHLASQRRKRRIPTATQGETHDQAVWPNLARPDRTWLPSTITCPRSTLNVTSTTPSSPQRLDFSPHTLGSNFMDGRR